MQKHLNRTLSTCIKPGNGSTKLRGNEGRRLLFLRKQLSFRAGDSCRMSYLHRGADAAWAPVRSEAWQPESSGRGWGVWLLFLLSWWWYESPTLDRGGAESSRWTDTGGNTEKLEICFPTAEFLWIEKAASVTWETRWKVPKLSSRTEISQRFSLSQRSSSLTLRLQTVPSAGVNWE